VLYKISINKIYFSLAGLLLIFSCTKEPVEPDVYDDFNSEGVLILNEGNFGSGNASLSYYDPDSPEVANEVFFRANQIPLGDVPQSILMKDDRLYITVSNSGKILVIQREDFKHIGSIGGLTAPRYMHFISDSQMIVSDLYEKNLTVVNTRSYEIERKIHAGSSTEQMVIVGDYLYAAAWSFNNKLYKISLEQLKTVDSLTTGIQPNSMVKDKEDRIWLLCDGGYPGNYAGHEHAQLQRIDPVNMRIQESFVFSDLYSSPTKLTINARGDSLYYIDGNWSHVEGTSRGIFRMPVNASKLPTAPFISANTTLFYGLGIDPSNGDIYCSDAMDYLQKGMVFRYGANGELVDSFRAGVIPGFFGF
jgi:hypothetical protein